MNTPVSFELAKLLKEKGYRLLPEFESSYPTISDVVMWLYEKHKIWISVSGDSDFKFRFEIHTWKWYEHEKCYRLGHTVLGETFWDCTSKEFNSPTKAYEAAIEYTLKNLI